jgi:hypothetical protein
VPMADWWPPGQIESGAIATLAGYSGIARKK